MTTPTDAPVTAEYYYKVKWGHQDEFIELFRKNHYPVLMEQVKSGRLLKFQAFEPRFHGEGRGDWTFMTVLVFKNWQAFGDGSGTAEIIQRLFPDQETYTREERRRFEILDAHWDVPLKPVSME
jgi:hypothetical protein